jgi:prepilin-type processing-associated H-X9-DG protein
MRLVGPLEPGRRSPRRIGGRACGEPIQSDARREYVAVTQFRARRLGWAALDEKGAKKMRGIIGTIGGTLLVVGAVAASATPASAGAHAGYHAGGTNSVFADGSVRFLQATQSTPTWAAAMTRAGGEVLSLD